MDEMIKKAPVCHMLGQSCFVVKGKVRASYVRRQQSKCRTTGDVIHRPCLISTSTIWLLAYLQSRVINLKTFDKSNRQEM